MRPFTTRTILLTRPAADIAATQAAYEAAGVNVLACPLLSAQYHTLTAPLHPQATLLLTSANAARALVHADVSREASLLAIGSHTQQVALEEGYINCTEAMAENYTPNSQHFARYIATHYDVDAPLIHLRSKQAGGGLVKQLVRLGFTNVSHQVTYSMQSLRRMPQDIITALQQGDITDIAFFSQRTLQSWALLLDTHQLQSSMQHLTLHLISPALRQAALQLQPKAVQVAPAPSLEAMVGLLNR